MPSGCHGGKSPAKVAMVTTCSQNPCSCHRNRKRYKQVAKVTHHCADMLLCRQKRVLHYFHIDRMLYRLLLWRLLCRLVAMKTKCLEKVVTIRKNAIKTRCYKKGRGFSDRLPWELKALLVAMEKEIYVDRLPCKQNTMKTGCHKDRKL